MKMNDWGEDQLIQYIQQQFSPPQPLVGIGDDCAVIPSDNKTALLVTTDALIEGVHCIRDLIPPIELGYKSLAVSVSDIAAMGGRPQYAFLSIAIPKIIDSQWIVSFFEGVKTA